MYDRVWKEIGRLCGLVNDFDKDYNVIMFESSDDVRGMININSTTIIVKAVFKDGALYYPSLFKLLCV